MEKKKKRVKETKDEKKYIKNFSVQFEALKYKIKKKRKI